jgi:predicted deacylase
VSVTVVHDPSRIEFERPGKHHYQAAFHLDGSWGYSLVPVTVINGLRPSGAGAPPGVAVFGGTHGDEYEGQIAVKRLCSDLDPAEMCGRLILVPQLNETACIAGQRSSPQDGVDMNRAFPGNPRGTLSFRIAHLVKTCIFPRVRIVVIGRLHDFSDHSSQALEVHAHRAGVVIALYFGAVCRKGLTLFVIAEGAALPQ